MCGMHPEDLGVGKPVRMIPRFAVLLVSERLKKGSCRECRGWLHKLFLFWAGRCAGRKQVYSFCYLYSVCLKACLLL